MNISKRTLMKWRREALVIRQHKEKGREEVLDKCVGHTITFAERILRLTQELIDIQLLKKE